MLKTSLNLAWHGLRHLPRVARYGMLLIAFLAAAAVLGLRYWVLPDIEQYHARITAAVSQLVGQPVAIGSIEADWQGVGPHLRLTDIRIMGKQGGTALALQHVDLVVSWMTVLAGELRLSSLEIDRPELLVMRNAQGALQISGIPLADQFQAEQVQAAGAGVSNMLLQQSRIVVRDARIAWLDEKRAAPVLLFRDVNLLIQNSWRHHRFAMRALPPVELSTQLDLRGDLSGNTFDDLPSWSGEIFTQLDYADVAAWKPWLDLPAPLRRGKGALRGWVGIEDGKVSRVTADLALANVQTRLAEDLPALEIRTLRGRVGWRDLQEGFEVSTNKLAFKLFNGFELRPTDILLSLSNTGDSQFGRGEVRANFLELADFGTLMEYLPLSRQLKQQLAEYAPRGRVENLQALWESAAGRNLHYELRARFDRLALHRAGNLPGFSGLSGEVDGTDKGGTLSINAHKLKLDAPQFLPEALAFDSVTAQSSWRSDDSGLEVKLSNISVVNDDLAGSAYGSYQTAANGPGKVDATLHLTRASVPHISRYIPRLALGPEARSWMERSLLDGKSSDASVRLKGNLQDFPFADNRSGIFKVQARAKEVAVEYAPGWPRVEHATADFLLQGKQMEITAPTAMTMGARLRRISVTMPDMLSEHLLLQVSGEEEGDTARALEFIQKSPVRGYLSGFTDGVTAQGSGKLSLQLAIPLAGAERVKVAGSYHFAGNDVDFGKSLPTVRKVEGDLQFTESGASTKNISAQILGGPARLVLESGAGGSMHARVGGTVNLDNLRKQIAHPLLQKVRGGAPWDLDIAVENKQSRIVLNSSLQGIQSDLPPPLAKRAGEMVPLHFEQSHTSELQEISSLQYGKWLTASFVRQPDAEGVWSIKRGKVLLGSVSKWRERDGIWIVGALPELSVEGWGALGAGGGLSARGTGGDGISIAGADVQIQKLTGYGNTIRDLHVTASSPRGVLTAQVAAREINGELSWQPREHGKLVVRLKNLSLGETDGKAGRETGPKAEQPKLPEQASAETGPAAALPLLDVVIDALSVKGRHLGKFELQAQQQEQDYLLQHMRVINPDGVLTIDGRWKMQPDAEQTQVNLRLEISNAGNILSRYGYPEGVKNGSGKLEGSFSWPGPPYKFSYARLDGNLRLETGKGQFLQIEPGVGKLLGIMSLQALPRHLTLDFDDVIRKGFEFNQINATASIKQGLMQTDDFRIEGSAAKVTMSGQVDLNRETQNLRVRVLPALGSSVSLLSFAAGPAVGVGVYLTQKLLRDPLDKLVSFEYNVTGSWADPKVEKIGSQPAQPSNPTVQPEGR